MAMTLDKETVKGTTKCEMFCMCLHSSNYAKSYALLQDLTGISISARKEGAAYSYCQLHFQLLFDTLSQNVCSISKHHMFIGIENKKLDIDYPMSKNNKLLEKNWKWI